MANSEWRIGPPLSLLHCYAVCREDDMEIDLPEVVAEVTAAFERYEQALVKNDVATLDAIFRDDARTIRYGVGENLYGYDEIKAFRGARSPVGLARTRSRTVITTYGRDFAVASTLFHRATSPGKIGRQMQTWVRFAEGWRVVAAHVSLIDAPAGRRHAVDGTRARRAGRRRQPPNACRGAAPRARRRYRARPDRPRRRRSTRPSSPAASACRARRCAKRSASWRPAASSRCAPIAARWWRGRARSVSSACSRRWPSSKRCARGSPPSA